MSELTWFSAKIRVVCLIETTGADVFNDSVHVFRAKDWDDAFQRAIQLGRQMEEEYLNDRGEQGALAIQGDNLLEYHPKGFS